MNGYSPVWLTPWLIALGVILVGWWIVETWRGRD
jgi:hypothetical protein